MLADEVLWSREYSEVIKAEAELKRQFSNRDRCRWLKVNGAREHPLAPLSCGNRSAAVKWRHRLWKTSVCLCLISRPLSFLPSCFQAFLLALAPYSLWYAFKNEERHYIPLTYLSFPCSTLPFTREDNIFLHGESCHSV